MTRLLWRLLVLAGVFALLTGASWAIAFNSVGSMLGSPPPQMGTQSTTILWHGMGGKGTQMPVWRFDFSPTLVPDAPHVQIFVSPIGRVIRTNPADLEQRLKGFNNR